VPVPKRRTGKTKKNMRRSHHALAVPNLIPCPSCGEKIQPHRVCPECGHYRDKLRVNIDND
jgi:large subunit ribosomal protein L32